MVKRKEHTNDVLDWLLEPDDPGVRYLALRDLVMDTAEELEMAIQTSAMTGGATDGGMIHLHKQGVPTVVIGVPCRHIHSHGAIIDRGDYDNALVLVTAVVNKLDAETVAGLLPE